MARERGRETRRHTARPGAGQGAESADRRRTVRGLEDALARRIQRLVSLMLFSSFLPYTVLLLMRPLTSASVLMLGVLSVGIAAVVGSHLWVRRFGDHVRAIEIMCWPGFLAVSVLMVAQGGVIGTAVWWLPLGPLIAFQGGAVRSGIAMSVLLPIELLVVQILSSHGALPAPIAPPLGETQRFLAICLSTLCISGLTAWGVMWRRRLLLTLDDALQAAKVAAEAKGRFIANMSHELRTPLHGIVGAGELLRASTLQEPQRQAVEVLQQSTETLADLVNDVLDFSKLESGRLKARPIATEPRALLRDTVGLFVNAARAKGLMITWRCTDEVPARAVFDGARVAQILRNLLSNAVKFTSSGEVHVQAGLLRDAFGNTTLELSVRDSGIGMDDAKLAMLFEPFTQADVSTTRRYGGSGLGLAISRDLAALIRARIDVRSQVGNGSTFTLSVPLAEPMIPLRAVAAPVAAAAPPAVVTPLTPAPSAPAAPAVTSPATAATPAAAPSAGSTALRVLVVEDHLVNQLVAERMLELLGAEVTLANDGAEAVRAVGAHAHPHAFDLVLMDCHMPVLDGFAATTRLRQLEQERGWPRLPIVAMTASSEDEVGQACREVGMDGLLPKPVALEQLRHVLERWCGDRTRAPGTEPA